jgi:hypothetical protein
MSSVIGVTVRSDETAVTLPVRKTDGRTRKRVQLAILFVIGVFYFGLSLYLLRAEMRKTGFLTYPLDDTYITMAIAKNLALHGVWGITQNGFSSASSSPGLVLLLAGVFRLVGPSAWWPLALSVGFGFLALILAQRLLTSAGLTTEFCALCAILFFTPLPVLGLLGMEHALHVALTLAFLDVVGFTLAEGRPPSWGLLLLTGLMVSVRYESLFMVMVACLLFFSQRKVLAAAWMGLAGAAPVAIYGVFAVLHGSDWLPQSVGLKGLPLSAAISRPTAVMRWFEDNLAHAPYMLALVAAMTILLALPVVRVDRRATSMLAIVLGATLFHLALAQVGWVYRYEAYLIAAGIAVIACAVPNVRVAPEQWANTALASIAGATLAQLLFAYEGKVYSHEPYVLAPAIAITFWGAFRGRLSRGHLGTAALLVAGLIGAGMLYQRTREAVHTLPYGSLAVYSQQIQTARFLHRYEEGASVAANDVGAINYYANIRCLDLVGLGDRDVYWLKKEGRFSTAALSKLAETRHVKIAVVYDSWFSTSQQRFSGPPLPHSWVRVARWQTPYGTFLGDTTVSFYATDVAEAGRLRAALDEFAPSLPPGVQVFDR